MYVLVLDARCLSLSHDRHSATATSPALAALPLVSLAAGSLLPSTKHLHTFAALLRVSTRRLLLRRPRPAPSARPARVLRLFPPTYKVIVISAVPTAPALSARGCEARAAISQHDAQRRAAQPHCVHAPEPRAPVRRGLSRTRTALARPVTNKRHNVPLRARTHARRTPVTPRTPSAPAPTYLNLHRRVRRTRPTPDGSYPQSTPSAHARISLPVPASPDRFSTAHHTIPHRTTPENHTKFNLPRQKSAAASPHTRTYVAYNSYRAGPSAYLCGGATASRYAMAALFGELRQYNQTRQLPLLVEDRLRDAFCRQRATVRLLSRAVISASYLAAVEAIPPSQKLILRDEYNQRN
ncbi:hypothetical protein HYPSUDRAFT_209150 [Hypholoma sublateritium FD-334 SS-4]|uniref:Uncharacterized protein n=1 Tax=Hypholoma sublateritium (strain FD-334 SS-4) TaxID=945553 RepID=A0A0D2NBH6_HYPSF|nr:hypothetical protein HYPSUDRAFT_209150 [Hypholoma sublateritium FD-334 SS-4]